MGIADGDAQSYWASASDPAAPVDVQLDFGEAKHVKSIEIEWENPAQAYELLVASGGRWTSIYSTAGNNLQATRYVGPAVSGSALKIRMTKPHPTLGTSGGHALYAIKSIRILALSTRAIIQDCVEAEDNTDSRDKFFMVAVPDFDPSVAAAAKQQAALLGAAQEHLGKLLAELYVAMPTLSACGFRASFGKQVPVAMLAEKIGSYRSGGKAKEDATSVAIGALMPAMGLDMKALRLLVESVSAALKQI